MNKMKLLCITLLCLFASLAFAEEGFSIAKAKDRVIRKYRYDRHNNDINVKAENRDPTQKDKMEFDVHTDGSGAKIVVKYETDPAKDKEGKFKVSYRFMIRGLVEYTPTAENEGFVKGVTPVVSGYPGKTKTYGNGPWSWGNFVEDAASTNETKIFKATTKDEIFSIIVKFNPPQVTEGGLVLEPNDIKFDLDINGTKLQELGYLLNTTNRIAILGVMQSKYKTHFCEDTNNAVCFNADDGRIAAFLKWANHLTCDGQNVNLIDSVVEVDNDLKDGGGDAGDNAQVAFWSIRGDITKFKGPCKWDPQLTTVENGQEGSATTVALSMFMILVALLALLM